MAIPLATVFQLIFMLISYCTAQDGSNAKFYDVRTYGAVANGKDDNSKVFFTDCLCVWEIIKKLNYNIEVASWF